MKLKNISRLVSVYDIHYSIQKKFDPKVRNEVMDSPPGILTSTFTETGTNLGLSSVAREERERLNQSAPFHLRASRLFWAVFHRFRRWFAGGLKQRCLDYSIYLPSCLYRASFYKVRFAGLWPKRWKNI